MFSRPLVPYVLTAALRDRLVISSLALVAIVASLAVFIGSSAVMEKSAFAVVFAAGALRVTGVAALVLFVVFYMRRAFDTKDVEYLLARPVSRLSFLLSHGAAFSLVAVLMTLIVVIAVGLLLPQGADISALILWGAGVMVEFVIAVNVALFFSMVLTSAVGGVLASAGLYVLARLMGELLGILATAEPLPGYAFLAGVMKMISLVVPRLDLLAQTSWLIYGAGNDVGYSFIFAQGALYTALLLAASYIDLRRRQF
ncbi:MAG TPA: hypothetical protein VIG74_02240 [Alphaproteobacteria bacterium]|jgi:ABC-type transport system involved in multi-copper enzyme maturation permease subunit